MTICILDTSIVTNIIPVPGRNQEHEAVMEELKLLIADRTVLQLPMAAIFETGNFIGQLSGDERWQVATRFASFVDDALSEISPFTAPQPVDPIAIKQWLSEFPEWAKQGSGFGDLSIKHEWERLCRLNPQRRVYIWSLDKHLKLFDTGERSIRRKR